MKVYVLTCDKYSHLLPGFAWLFNKYWSATQEVTVLGFGPIPRLPQNFSFKSLAPAETLPWTDHMLKYFSSCGDDRFVLLLDDYWLTKAVDLDRVNLMHMHVGAGAAKGDLSANTYVQGAEPYGEEDDLWIANQDARYRSSTQPCIWSQDYLIRLLVRGRHIWDFERLGARDAKNDGAKIIGPQHAIYDYANIYKKGEFVASTYNKITKADRLELKQAGYLNFIEEN